MLSSSELSVYVDLLIGLQSVAGSFAMAGYILGSGSNLEEDLEGHCRILTCLGLVVYS